MLLLCWLLLLSRLASGSLTFRGHSCYHLAAPLATGLSFKLDVAYAVRWRLPAVLGPTAPVSAIFGCVFWRATHSRDS